MRIVRDDRYGILRLAEAVWPEASTDERQSANSATQDEADKRESSIFTLARAIVDKGSSRRRLRRASSII